ncbi:MAG TPA: hypothetical protein VMN60_06070, partial [Longimicrobiales bacterium]|nr:hypothetical protein [Longimicrobiales bacterium]
ISVSNTVVRNNRIEGAGTAGVFVFEACYNTLFGNAFKLDRNVDGVAFAPSSGGNTYVGNKNIVVDAGDRDCDLEGNIDPNVLTGAGQKRSGPLGFTVRHAAHLSNDIR